MAEINNSLAASVASQPLDLRSTLAAIAQIQEAQAKTGLLDLQSQQEARKLSGFKYLQTNPRDVTGAVMRGLDPSVGSTLQDMFYKQGNREKLGYDPGDVSSLASASRTTTEQKAKEAEIWGSVGNMVQSDPSPTGVQRAIQAARKAGLSVSPLEENHYLTLAKENPSQITALGKQLSALGQSGGQFAETSGQAAGAKAAATAPYEPVPINPNAKMTTRAVLARTAGGRPISDAQKYDDENVRRGLETPTPEQRARGVVGPGDVPGISGIGPKAQAEQTVEGDILGKEYGGYKDEAKNAAMTKYLLKNLQDETARFATGKGATAAGTAKQWLQAAGQLPGVGPAVQKITGDISDPVAAFEAVQKNAGQLTRATLKDVEGRAAMEYKMIQQQLPNAEMSPKGLQQVTAQMMAPEDYKQARLQAADVWKKTHNDSIDGFAADWNKNIGPGAFLFARLPAEEQAATVQRLSKTAEGKRTLDTIKKQMQWAHERGLDSVID